ncbi:MAG TPA: transketolase [Terriglobales bacterium]|nr:transketolase [Terriglobales bacterium]
MTSVVKNLPATEHEGAFSQGQPKGSELDHLCVNTLRMLALDQVEKAHSGHPGLPLGAAPMAYVLWDRFLRHNPRNPRWFNRDRFVLSAGHGCALLYSLLHLYGYDMPMEQLKQFRQFGSETPGHPEYNIDRGIEATTGPLGQGFGMGVGMALAGAHLAGCFNKEELGVVDHYTYAIVSDGDLMEGVSAEAASLAGTLKLGKLIYLYDNNHISIEGSTDLAFTESVVERFRAYHWHVQTVPDGNDLDAVEAAIRLAQAHDDQPSLIAVHNHIGYGSPLQDTAAVHGEAMGPENVKATKEKLGWPLQPDFYIPDAALAHFRQALPRGEELEAAWKDLFQEYRGRYPKMAQDLQGLISGTLPQGWDFDLPVFPADPKGMATRDASGKTMNAIAGHVQSLVGGSADLAPSTKTTLTAYGDIGMGCDSGRNLHFGVREHGMGTIVNGMALHGGIIPYGATFLIFSDYMRGSIRLAALMNTHSLFVFTHDSIGLGEDGPTHEPVEHLMSLRAMPNMTVMRPGDANETVEAWRIAIQRQRPMAMALTRQKIPVLDVQRYPIREGVAKGAYVLAEAEGGKPQIVLIATGSEVQLAMAAREELGKQKIAARVVSMPCWELFDEQPAEYRKQVLPAGVPKLAIEAGATLGWCRYVGEDGGVVGIDRFGASAPGNVVMEKLGFNVPNVVEHARRLLKGAH